jgi:hypothetical protein
VSFRNSQWGPVSCTKKSTAVFEISAFGRIHDVNIRITVYLYVYVVFIYRSVLFTLFDSDNPPNSDVQKWMLTQTPLISPLVDANSKWYSAD